MINEHFEHNVTNESKCDIRKGNKMPKEIVVTGLGNRIEYATTNGKGLITGKREDITDDYIRAVFEHMMREYKRGDKDKKTFGYAYGDLGEIHYHPPKTRKEYEEKMDLIEENKRLKKRIKELEKEIGQTTLF